MSLEKDMSKIEEKTLNRIKTYFTWIGSATLFFFVIYGYCNYSASKIDAENLYHLYFDWELKIPFIPWMIIPYRSLDFIFITIFFLLDSAKIKRYGKQMMLTMLIAGIIFIILPGACGYIRPNPESLGIWAPIYKVLYTLDKPHNLYPSLHITYSYLGIQAMKDHNPSLRYAIPLTLWFILICFSIILTYQHHLIDLVSGLILGILAYKYSFVTSPKKSEEE